jgi:hypothetical protein
MADFGLWYRIQHLKLNLPGPLGHVTVGIRCSNESRLELQKEKMVESQQTTKNA